MCTCTRERERERQRACAQRSRCAIRARAARASLVSMQARCKGRAGEHPVTSHSSPRVKIPTHSHIHTLSQSYTGPTHTQSTCTHTHTHLDICTRMHMLYCYFLEVAEINKKKLISDLFSKNASKAELYLVIAVLLISTKPVNEMIKWCFPVIAKFHYLQT